MHATGWPASHMAAAIGPSTHMPCPATNLARCWTVGVARPRHCTAAHGPVFVAARAACSQMLDQRLHPVVLQLVKQALASRHYLQHAFV